MQLKPLRNLTPCREVCRPEPLSHNLPAMSCRTLLVVAGLVPPGLMPLLPVVTLAKSLVCSQCLSLLLFSWTPSAPRKGEEGASHRGQTDHHISLVPTQCGAKVKATVIPRQWSSPASLLSNSCMIHSAACRPQPLLLQKAASLMPVSTSSLSTDNLTTGVFYLRLLSWSYTWPSQKQIWLIGF